MEFPAVCVPMYLCQNGLSEYGPIKSIDVCSIYLSVMILRLIFLLVFNILDSTPNPKSVEEVLHEELEKVEVDKPNVDNINWVSNLGELFPGYWRMKVLWRVLAAHELVFSPSVALNLKGKPHAADFNLILEDKCGYVSCDLPLACDPSVHDLDFNMYGCRSYLVNRDGHELELDFKRDWKGFRSSTSEKDKEKTLNWTVDIFCRLVKQHPNITQFSSRDWNRSIIL
ncbi:unnamed protein product [Fraxinus pennsylvanica]|uniref:Uncharacterized protein n=1 Tax=Fraxinus pennsylvanica TaxID=56036 RepID=A0AAD2E0F4_9LAMI|nr:unnamed protein product [Fraxinus pennsylvanica]